MIQESNNIKSIKRNVLLPPLSPCILFPNPSRLLFKFLTYLPEFSKSDKRPWKGLPYFLLLFVT